jgi:hypothetical protein
LPPSARRDEISLVPSSATCRGAAHPLAHKTRLAALGTAVSKINHDLRNILASAMVVSIASSRARIDVCPSRHACSGARSRRQIVQRDPNYSRRGGDPQKTRCAGAARG